MHKAILSAAIAATMLLVAGIAIHSRQPTTTSAFKVGHTVDIYKLESTINLKALPRDELNYED